MFLDKDVMKLVSLFLLFSAYFISFESLKVGVHCYTRNRPKGRGLCTKTVDKRECHRVSAMVLYLTDTTQFVRFYFVSRYHSQYCVYGHSFYALSLDEV